ncbi:hypothetical protein K435DRAFT_222079 [Dendrothele bispora CBS 962.96]|uniref:DUF6535 domain-containing protein n=1 Tax=Dendrothele bispora (strain CBS 962.96) TaxID=1314807 RepID=A0A4S8LR04_DENBC|nr:hypothetical protein K435DRAFT_222079 [Dendrothele bispora CBS 962.96]
MKDSHPYISQKDYVASVTPSSNEDVESSKVDGTNGGDGMKESRRPTFDEEACSKLWSVYIGEAQKYDQHLLRGWKNDMDGILLFSALYSASLTAFIIESYKKLQGDPSQDAVLLLVQISQQLASMSNGTTAQFQSLRNSDSPATSSIICNMLWFISLALALTCSLLATFIQQWTRDFIHKTSLRPSPVRHARILAFMYFGLRDFGMHAFVDMIPMLLHVSLFLFLAGLVSFLIPVNRPLAYLVAIILAMFLTIYIVLTCLPPLYLNAPYRTPFSSVLWRLGNNVKGILTRRRKFSRREQSLTDTMLDESMMNPLGRDQQALVYTLNSLTDDEELLPFIESIPDVVCGPNGIRISNREMLMPLVHSRNPDVNIISRISELIQRTSHWPDGPRRSQSWSACGRALWSLAFMLIQGPKVQPQLEQDNYSIYFFDHKTIALLLDKTSCFEFSFSAVAAIHLSRMSNLRHCVRVISQMLSPSVDRLHPRTRLLSAKNIWLKIGLAHVGISYGSHLADCCYELSEALQKATVTSVETHMEDITRALTKLQSERPWLLSRLSILVGYLVNCTNGRILPFELDIMCKVILPHLSVEVTDEEWLEIYRLFIITKSI